MPQGVLSCSSSTRSARSLRHRRPTATSSVTSSIARSPTWRPLLTEAGRPVVIDATAHRRAWRELARQSIPRFAEVQLVCPLRGLPGARGPANERPRPRGIYAHAGRPGARVPGVDVPYEAAPDAEPTIDTSQEPLASAAAASLRWRAGLPGLPRCPRRRRRRAGPSGSPGSREWQDHARLERGGGARGAVHSGARARPG